jgi:[protein-PII] uridylyltransferase
MVSQLLAQIHAAESMGTLAPIVNWHNDIDLGMTVVNVVTWDRAGLFYKLAGALTLAGVSIISTKAISRKDHITIDTFYVIDPSGGVVTDKKAQETFQVRLEEALIEGKELLPAINEREAKVKARNPSKDMLPAPFPPSVDVYHELSLKQTIIEVQANDRIGLLYQISRLITFKGFDISFARIATERGVAMDTFYIKNVNDSEESNTTALLELREELDSIVKD